MYFGDYVDFVGAALLPKSAVVGEVGKKCFPSDRAGGAVGGDGAPSAMRVAWGAALLAKGDDVGVPRLPVAYGQERAQRHFGFEWRLSLNESEAVHDPMNVDIHANRWFIKAKGNH